MNKSVTLDSMKQFEKYKTSENENSKSGSSIEKK